MTIYLTSKLKLLSESQSPSSMSPPSLSYLTKLTCTLLPGLCRSWCCLYPPPVVWLFCKIVFLSRFCPPPFLAYWYEPFAWTGFGTLLLDSVTGSGGSPSKWEASTDRWCLSMCLSMEWETSWSCHLSPLGYGMQTGLATIIWRRWSLVDESDFLMAEDLDFTFWFSWD